MATLHTSIFKKLEAQLLPVPALIMRNSPSMNAVDLVSAICSHVTSLVHVDELSMLNARMVAKYTDCHSFC